MWLYSSRSFARRIVALARMALVSLVFTALVVGCESRDDTGGGETPTLLAFVGAASKPPTEELIAAFEAHTGIRVDATFGGSGYVLAQMELAQRGDIYFPGSSDYMEIARRKGRVIPESETIVVYLVPAINVQRGNPKNIRTLADLATPGLRVAIANPQGVCVGMYAIELLEAHLSPAQLAGFRQNLANYTESCEKTATAVALKSVDAVIGWSVFEHWDSARIETIPLPADQVLRVGYIPIAISTYSTQRELAQQFIDFAHSETGQEIFRKHHYFMSPQDAFAYIGAEKPVGGEYEVPPTWLSR